MTKVPNQAQYPNPVAQAQQAPYQAPNAPSTLSDSITPGAAGDAPETSVAIRARNALRDARKLSAAQLNGGVNASGRLPAGTYAFVSPNALIAAVEKGDEANLPVQGRRAVSTDFEIHNVDGVSYVTGFVDQKVATALRSSFFSSLGQLELLPTATGPAACPVDIPVSSLRSPKLVTSPTQALRVTIQPRTKDEPFVPSDIPGCQLLMRSKS